MIESQEGVSWSQWRAIAAAAEEHGLQGLYGSDHYLSELPGSDRDALDIWGTICGLAAVTSRIRLGTLVSPATFRHPSVLAKLVVTADHLSGGRVDLAMGTGWFEAEHQAYGFPFPSQRERMDVLEEQVEIIRRSWGTERFSFRGSHYEIVDLDARPKPLRPGRPRLVIGGGGGPRSLALAADWADEYNTPLSTDALLRRLLEDLRAAFERAGRDPATARVSVMTPIVVGVNHREVEQRVARARRLRGATSPPETWIVGTPAQVVERLHELEALGVAHAVVEAVDHADLEMVALLGRAVLPEL